MKIVVSGSIAFDYLMSFPGRFKDHILPDQIEQLSVSFLVDSMERRRGGVAPNIAYTLALLGGRPSILGTAGQDFGDYRAWLESQGVDTAPVLEVPDQFTASFFVNSDLDNNQIASFYIGAMAYARDISIAGRVSEPVDLVIVSPDDPQAMIQRPQECRQLGIPYVYDPSQQIVRLSGEELAAGIEGSLLVILNEYEFGMVREKTGWSEADVLDRAGGLVVTRGEKGSLVRVAGQEYLIPVVAPERIVDPTGVGDAFRAGLLRGYSLNLPWEIAGRMGSLAAAYVLEQVGTLSHFFTRADFVARYRQHFDDLGALDVLVS